MGIRFEREGRHLLICVSGKLDRDDYDAFVPEADRLIGEEGVDRLLIDLHGFEGWTLGAMVADLRFDIRHFADIARIAVAGEGGWEKVMTAVFSPFTLAKVRYFPREEIDAARHWVDGE